MHDRYQQSGGKICRLCRWYLQICRRCQWHRRQIMGTISGCKHLIVNLKAKIYIYVNSTTKQRCPNKIINIFRIEDDFFHLPPASMTPVVHLELRISPRIFEQIRSGPLRGLGETNSWKNQKSKISWHCPFKARPIEWWHFQTTSFLINEIIQL